MSDFKEALAENFDGICLLTQVFLKAAAQGEPIYLDAVSEITWNYLDVLVNYNSNLEQDFVAKQVANLFNFYSNFLTAHVQYIREGEGYRIF